MDSALRLGIVVVYAEAQEAGSLIELHLDRVRRHTDAQYTVYAGIDRLAAPSAALLEREPNVRTFTFGPVAERGSAEHSHYQLLLLQEALSEGVTHTVHLHMDSFPVRDGWAREVTEGLGPECALAGVAATEVGERNRPRSWGLVAPRGFYEEYEPLVPIAELPTGDPAYRCYRSEFAGPDSADAYGFVLSKHGLPWRRLMRSNAREDHYLMGGIYGDLIFHLGAATRSSRRFPPRGATPEQVRGLRRALGAGRAVVPHALRRLVPGKLLRPWNPDGADTQQNDRTFAAIRERLLADPDGYLAYLRGTT